MSPRNITRSEFLRDGSCLAAGALLIHIATPGAAASAEPACQRASANKDPCAPHPGMTLRPYQLMCLICSVGSRLWKAWPPQVRMATGLPVWWAVCLMGWGWHD